MDWTKAKSILIAALVVTNLILIITYVFQNSSVKNNEEELQSITMKLLAEKNIFIETDIPEDHHRMPKLTVQYDKINEDVINEQLANQAVLGESEQTDENLVAVTSAFIENCGLMTENVTFDRIDRKDGIITVTYKNYVNGISIEESYIICTVKDGIITDFKRYWLNPVEVGDMKKEVISAAAALIKFMSEKTEEGEIHVKDISLVYWLDSDSFDTESPVTDTAFPAWKITDDRGKAKYIAAWEQ